jgi:hypothetical protein
LNFSIKEHLFLITEEKVFFLQLLKNKKKRLKMLKKQKIFVILFKNLKKEKIKNFFSLFLNL